jgi:peptidoglycan/LPS O-acetylase OafA/YrhL
MNAPDRPGWLLRIETLGTTIVVLMIGGMMLWFEAAERESRVLLVIGLAVLIYATALMALGRRSDPSTVAWWPFAAAGLAAGSVAELINARLLLSHESLAAALTGVVIGTAHWIALRAWLKLGRRPAGR